jgi:hypothetical protein
MLVALWSFVCVLSARVAYAQEGGEGAPVDTGGEVFDEPYEETNEEAPELPESDETEGRLEREQPPDPHADNVIWTLGASGSFNYGNSRTLGLNVSSSLGVRNGPEVVVIEGAFQYVNAQPLLSCGSVQANPDPSVYPQSTIDYCTPPPPSDGSMQLPPMPGHNRAPGFNDWTEIAVNLNWRLRWDHFVDPANAFFLAHRGRIDRFGGLRPRISLNFGYSRIVFEEREHLLSFDLGLDASFDFFNDAVRAQNLNTIANGGHLPVFEFRDGDRRFVPSVLLGVTYVNHLTPYLTYDTILQALWDVANPTHLRFEWVNHLRTAIDQTFQIRLDVTVRFDSLPPGQLVSWVEQTAQQTVLMLDVLTTLTLQGSFDLDGPARYRSSVEPEQTHPDEHDEHPRREEPRTTAAALNPWPT